MVKETYPSRIRRPAKPRLVSIPSRGSGKGDFNFWFSFSLYTCKFQSPLGEVVKETKLITRQIDSPTLVSIPSRGSGKGDLYLQYLYWTNVKFQSPLGEVVKETLGVGLQPTVRWGLGTKVSIPSRGSGKGE